MIPKHRPFLFPLKQTSKIDMIGRFPTYLGETNNSALIALVRPICKQMQELRDNLNFKDLQMAIDYDPSQLANAEYHIINYLRLVYFFDNYFSQDFDTNNTIISFPWTSSFEASKISRSVPHIKYELLSILYNTSQVYIGDGVIKIAVPFEEEIKNGVEKLSIALWALEEMKLIVNFLSVDIYTMKDLNEKYIEFLIQYVKALIYSAWTQKIDENSSYETLASASIAASLQFKKAFDALSEVKEVPLPENEFLKLRIKLIFNHHMHNAVAHYNMAMHIANDPDKTSNDDAYISEYLDKAIEASEDFLKHRDELEDLEPEETEELFVVQDMIGKMLKKYPANLGKVQDLPEIPSFYKFPKAYKPKDLFIRVPSSDDPKFEAILPQKVKEVKSAFDYQVTLETSGIENLLEKLRSVKTKQFMQFQVDSLASLESQAQSSGKVQIPEGLKKKIEIFKKSGGTKAYFRMKQNVAEMASTCKILLNELKSMVAQDRAEDEKLIKTYGESFNPNELCEAAFKSITNVKVLEQKFLQAQEADVNFWKNGDKQENWMKQFMEDDTAILELLLQNSDSQFLSKNQKLILEISQLNKAFLNEISQIPAKLKKVNDAFKRNDFTTSYIRVANGITNQEEEFQTLIAPYEADLEEIKEKIGECYPKVDQIAGKASVITSNSSKTPLKILTDMNEAIDEINRIFDVVNNQSIIFYSELTARLIDLKDFLPSMLTQKNKERQEYLAKNPFFNQNEMQFPMGQSIFVYKKPENQPQMQQGGMLESLVIQKLDK